MKQTHKLPSTKPSKPKAKQYANCGASVKPTQRSTQAVPKMAIPRQQGQ